MNIAQKLYSGRLGAQPLSGGGYIVRLFTGPAAETPEVCWFREPGSRRAVLIPMQEAGSRQWGETQWWECALPEARPGQRYGFRVPGVWNPKAGFRHDRSKVVVDPAARLVSDCCVYNAALHSKTDQFGRLVEEDSLPYSPLGVFGNPLDFDWEGVTKPQIAPGDLVIWEAPFRGATIKLAQQNLVAPIPKEKAAGVDLRYAKPGTFRALASEHVIGHLHRLHVTAVELYVAQQSMPHCRGAWGYMPLVFGAPDFMLAERPSHPLSVEWEFKYMVKRLHQAGIMVILDLVYNHTLEGSELGPTVSLKGLDNSCYLLCGSSTEPAGLNCYHNFSGCGNAMNLHHAPMRLLAIETLERWLEEFQVDAVRFDLLGTMLGDRFNRRFDPSHPFLADVAASPVLSQALLIGEPWSAHNYDDYLCRLEKPWVVWNVRYRNSMRLFWLGREHTLGAFVDCVTGSRNEFPPDRHGFYHVVGGMFYHDGFNRAQWLRHNHSTHGDSNNCSWDCGADGIPDDAALLEKVEADRWLIWKASFFASAISPIFQIRAGDEMLFYPPGGYAADADLYCAGDEGNGIEWDADPRYLAYSQGVMDLRARFPNLGRMRFEPTHPPAVKASPYGCYTRLGHPMPASGWKEALGGQVTMYLPGQIEDVPLGPDTRPLIVMFNAADNPVPFQIPYEALQDGRSWIIHLDSGRSEPFLMRKVEGGRLTLGRKSAVLLVSEQS